MNKVIMCGRMTADPEVKTGASSAGEYTVTKFSIAVDRRFKKEGEKDADFFNCVAFAKTAAFIGKYFSKGQRILVTGRLENNEFTNKEGAKVKATNVIVEEAEFADSKKSEPPASDDSFMSVPDNVGDSLPF